LGIDAAQDSSHIVRNRTVAIPGIAAYHQLHEWILLLPVLFAAHRGSGNLLNPA
jgi:hypothetical protein